MLHKVQRALKLLFAFFINSAPFLPATSGKFVVFDIHHMVSSRPIRWLSIILNLSGYQVYWKLSFSKRTLNVLKTIHWHENQKILWRLPKSLQNTIIFTDSPENYQERSPKKIVNLAYDYGPALGVSDNTHFTIPFLMHSQIYVQYEHHLQVHEFRQNLRQLRGLFAGNSDDVYDNELITEVSGILGRQQIVNHLSRSPSIRMVDNLSYFDTIRNHNDIALLTKVRLIQSSWLQTLAKADFAFALPGVTFPLAHVAVEAMAVGTIPILNYPDWFIPMLEDGINCFTFSTREDLDQIIIRIRSMPEDEIATMKRNTEQYYDKYLNSAKFGHKLLDTPLKNVTLHVLDESDAAVYRAMGK